MLAGPSTALRKVLLVRLLGVMKSVERVEFMMFSSAGEAALVAVGVEQRGGRLAVHHQRELPHQVVGVLDAGVGAARAEGRDLVRRVADEEHATVIEAVHAPALEGTPR